jgi:hypothetical protein
MLDDLTSGYNIATILTLNPKYNEMMGFTQEEVNLLMTVTGVAPALITIDMEGYYNGYLFLSKVYVPMSEYEAMSGRADIFLQRNPNLPQVKYEWVFELKYCKTSATDREIAAKCDKGLVQLKQYAQSRCLGERPDLKAAVLVFTGKNQYLIETI